MIVLCYVHRSSSDTANTRTEEHPQLRKPTRLRLRVLHGPLYHVRQPDRLEEEPAGRGDPREHNEEHPRSLPPNQSLRSPFHTLTSTIPSSARHQK